MAKIILKIENKADEEFPLKGKLTIGRKNTNDVVLNDNACSREHAEIIESAEVYKIKDLGSHNGTLLNGVKIKETILKENDVITIGKAKLCFEKGSIDEMLGERIGGYKILAKLGEGGMGIVYKARQISMDRIVALKVLSANVTKNMDYINAFIQEAKVAGQLNHDNAVNVHDFGKTDKGIYYLSMEFVEGENIQQILDKKGKLPTGESVIIISRVASALDYAHEHSIVHSDIKPQNILLDKNGKVKLADLGLAKHFGKGSFDHDPDTVMGTPYYMSPEQATKEKIDHRTDIYSLGATFFHMITGRPPFDGDSALSILTKHVTEPVPSPRKYDITISVAIDSLIRWMMEKSPDNRPASIKQLEEKLNLIKDQETQKSSILSERHGHAVRVKKAMATRRKRSAKRNPVPAIILGTLIAVIVVAGIVWLKRMQSMKDSSSRQGQGEHMVSSNEYNESPESNEEPVIEDITSLVPEEKGIFIDFNDYMDVQSLLPLSDAQWEGWHLEKGQGYFEYLNDRATGFAYRGIQFDSRAFSCEIAVIFNGSTGSFSCYLEGTGVNQRVGFHFNHEGIILFASGEKKEIILRRKSGIKYKVRIESDKRHSLVIFVDDTHRGTLLLDNLPFKGYITVKVGGAKIILDYIKVKERK